MTMLPQRIADIRQIPPQYKSWRALYEQSAAHRRAWAEGTGPGQAPGQPPLQPPARKYLGDHIETALTAVGITKERVSKWLGRPCGCRERRERLNQLDRWARRSVTGHLINAKKHLAEILKG